MRPKISDIIAAVGAHYGVAKIDIESDRREAKVVHARHVCFWLDKTVPPLAEFVEQLKFVSPDILARKLQHAVRSTGGFWTPPQEKYGNHLFVIDLMGVNATGFDEEEACHNWRNIALRVVKAQAA